MPMHLQDVLDTALDDEFKARATYRKILEHHGPVRPFVRIVESEERHIEALAALYRRHGLAMPVDPWPDRVRLPPSLAEACREAVEGERANAALYERLILSVEDYPDVRRTLRNLQAASQENHLPAFERCLARETGGRGRRAGSAGRGRGRGRGGPGGRCRGDG